MKKLIFLTFVLFSASVKADFYTGNKLKTLCNSQNYVESSVCMGYVNGVTDSFSGYLICLPPDVTTGQLVDMVKKYMNDNPAKLHEPSTSIVIDAIKKDFPCKKK